MMRFDLMAFGMILAGTAFAVPVQESFESNKEKILAGTTSVVGDLVFSVGRARQVLRAGDEVGFAKAAALAFANLDLLNFKNVQWPASVSADEKKAVWMIYRSKHPFRLTIDGGQRVYSSKTGNDSYLVVMSFPRENVLVEMPRNEDIDEAISQYREELKRLTEEAQRIAAERCATNGCCVQSVQMESRTDDAAGQPLQKAEDTGAVKKHENLDEDLML